MDVVVFDSDVLIGFLNRDDAHHADAVLTVERSLSPGTRRLLSAVNYSEILVGPLRAGRQEVVEQMLVKLGIEIIVVDSPLAERAAAVRERTGLKLPDAYAVATGIHAEKRGRGDVRIESFDKNVRGALSDLGR
jgi:predicted nucleic acid-binding protein